MTKVLVAYKTGESAKIRMGVAEMSEQGEPEKFAKEFLKKHGFTEVVVIETPNTIDANHCDFWNEDGEVAREHF